MSTLDAQLPTCSHCSYSLAGLPPDANCPECGTPSTYKDPDATLNQHTICPKCGYSLSGLKVSNNCPECGSPCKDAIIDFSIYHAGPAYVNRLASGASLVLTSAYLFVLAILALFGSIFFMGQLGVMAGGAGPGAGMLLGVVVYFGLLLAASIVWLVGWIRATAPDPRYQYQAPSHSTRGLTRGMAIAIFCLWVVSIIPFIGPLASLANFVCFIIFFFAATTYIKRLAQRIPDPKLTKSAGSIRLFVGIMLPIIAISFLATIVAAASAFSSAPNRQVIGPGIAGLAMLGMLGGSLLVLLAYLRLVGRFAKSMKLAKARCEHLPAHTPQPMHMQ